MGDPHHYKKAARYARAAWLGKSAPGAEKLGISYPGVPAFRLPPGQVAFLRFDNRRLNRERFHFVFRGNPRVGIDPIGV